MGGRSRRLLEGDEVSEQDPDRAPQGYRVYGSAKTPKFLVTESSIELSIGQRFAEDLSIRADGHAFGVRLTRTAMNARPSPSRNKRPCRRSFPRPRNGRVMIYAAVSR